MNTILNFAVSGMNAAQKRFAVSAENVVNVNTPGYRAKRADQIDTGHGPAVIVSQPQTTSAQSNETAFDPDLAFDLAGNDVDLAEEFVDMIRSKTAFQASAKVIQAQDELVQGFLDIFA